MEIKEVGARELQMIQSIWKANAKLMPDDMRGEEVPYALLFEDAGATRWYAVLEGECVLVVGDLRPDLSASMLMLNHELSPPRAIFDEVRDVIDEFGLHRIQANVPSPAKSLKASLREIGFRQEGHLRRATYYDGRLTGIDIFAMYRDPSKKRDYVKVKEETYAVA